ncbi:MAG TPA: hypothetical protein VHL11_02145, partial [Phototrophicaceae bacterium]|nr:hypothetical protein [Phototrophicaceae bacterium]
MLQSAETAGNLNQLLTKYAELDQMQRGFLDLIAQASSPQQALKYARSAVFHSPTLLPIITALLEVSHPDLLPTLTKSESLTESEPERKPSTRPSLRSRHPARQFPIRQFPTLDNLAYQAAVQSAPFTLSPDAAPLPVPLDPQTQPPPPHQIEPPLPDWIERIPHLQRIKLDPELGRLAIALNCASPLRLWLLGRELSPNGCGWIGLAELRAKAQEQQLKLRSRQFRRLIARGEGVFWRQDHGTQRLYLEGIVDLAVYLTRHANQINPAL